MEKEHLIERLNEKADSKLREIIKKLPFGDPTDGENFYPGHVQIKYASIKEFINQNGTIIKDGKIEGEDKRTIRFDLLLKVILEDFFQTYKEKNRKRFQEEFIHKVDSIKDQIENLIISVEQRNY